MSKLTKIERVYLGDGYDYDLYVDDARIAADVPFEVLAAAPEMLAVLKRLVDAKDDDYDSIHEQAERAIAKAEGRE